MKKFETIELAMAHITEQDVIIAEGKKNNEALEASLTAALAEVAAISAKLDLSEKHKGANIVTINKKNYQVLGNRFFVNGEELDAEGLMKNENELKRMIAIKSGSLIEVAAD